MSLRMSHPQHDDPEVPVESNEHTQTRASVDPHDPLVGRVLDNRYRIDSRIARGGMAAVYLAHDVRLDRTVAVKVMHPGMAEDPAFVDRFVREARAAAQLTHPNVVSVHDQGEDAGTLFLAMEYVPGHTLRDVIREAAPMAPGRALAQIEPVLQALAAAHRAGLVHRDVKPENVLIAPAAPGEQPIAKVADFGLAKAVNTATQHTATGVVIGSVSYLAPELVVKGRADERVDVYAAGVVLYELLTGRKPHEGESPIQIAYAHVHTDIPAPSLLVPGIPGYVDALVARATARDVDQRPSDAGVLLHHVRRVAQALREGVSDDPDLESDLRPHTAIAPLDVEIEAERHGITDVEDTESSLPLAPPTVASSVPTAATGGPEHTQQIDASTFTPTASAPAMRRLPTPTADESLTHTQRPRGRGKGPLTLLVSLALLAALALGGWWMFDGRYETTPSVLELSAADASTALEDAGFEVAAGEPTYSENVPKDAVVDTVPGPGEKVLAGDTVTLVLSLGPERYEVPSLEGRTLDEASTTLAESKLEIGREVAKFHDTVEQGRIISTDPAAGTEVRPGTAVKVTTSKGRKPIEVADHSGKKADAAEKTLKKSGLEVDVEKKFSHDVAEGVVISQDPKNGTLFKGDRVTLVVSQGPELVTVPQLRGQGLAEAKKTLEGLGFKVATKKSSVYLGLQYVAGSDPGSGQKARKGSTITLSLV